MATIPTDVSKSINSMYDQQKKNQLSALAESQRTATSQLNQQKTETGQQYYDKRNQADVVNFQNRRALQEMMANSGLSRSGENITGQVALNSSRQNTLGGLNREEQSAINAINTQISEVNNPSKQNSIISEIEAARSAALADALERAIDRAEQQRQFNEQLAWEKEQFNRQMALKSSGGGGGRSSSGSSKKSSSSKSSSSSNLSKQYNQYKSQQSTVSKPTALRNLDTYYKNQESLVSKVYKNPILQPVAPAKNQNLSSWQKMKMIGG